MSQVKLGFIAPYQKLVLTAEKIARNLGEEIFVTVTDVNDIAAHIKLHQEKGVDVIITRGPLIELSRQTCNLPVVSCDPTSVDILEALYQAKSYGEPVGFVSFFKVSFALDVIEKIIGLQVRHFPVVSSHEQAMRVVNQARQEGLNVLIGGIGTIEYAQKLGLTGILVDSGSNTIFDAIQKGNEVAKVSRMEKEKTERLKTILDLTAEGVIATDGEDQIMVLNPVAEKILGLQAQITVGQISSKLIPELKLDQVLKTGQEKMNELCHVGKVYTVANKVPIKVAGKTVGVVATIQDVSTVQSQETQIRKELYQKGLTARHNFRDIITQDIKMKKIIAIAKEFSLSNSTVLITGETGTGKELMAQSIHNFSSRQNGPFVAVNCAALPEDLLESELFGYEEGAFTGARKGGKQGLFELAHRGTIFLDEIRGTSLRLQARLLRVIEEKEVMPIAGNRVIPLDIRIIASTNGSLLKEVRRAQFREDLFYRLSVLRLELIPLRERLDDLQLLIEHFLSKYLPQNSLSQFAISKAGMEKLALYGWPGNIRELQHFVERYATLAFKSNLFCAREVETMLIDDLFVSGQAVDRMENDQPANILTIREGPWDYMERQIIAEIEKRTQGNKSEMARFLGLSRTTLWKKLKSH